MNDIKQHMAKPAKETERAEVRLLSLVEVKKLEELLR